MHEFHLPDMTRCHCASMVSVALKRFDPACGIQVDLPRHMVSVKSSEDPDALVETAYPPSPAHRNAHGEGFDLPTMAGFIL